LKIGCEICEHPSKGTALKIENILLLRLSTGEEYEVG
jgi:hypothetical protein